MTKDDDIFWVEFNTLKNFIRDVFIGVGVPDDEAALCADVLITADKRGIDTHGIGRLKHIYYDRIKLGVQSACTRFEIVKQGLTTAVVDGHHGMGHVIGARSMQMAIDKAKKYGMGMVAVRNSTHYGIAGYYVLMATKAGAIGITGTNARPSVAPIFGVQNMLGTNPLAFGIPTDEQFPFVLDCSTSVTQRGKIELYDRMGKDIPTGWVIDEQGRSLTVSHQILHDLTHNKATLVPLGGFEEESGGHKGYGYATAVEILCAALQQGAFLTQLQGREYGRPSPYKLGHFFVAIDVEAFTELDKFKKMTGDILRALRNSKKATGAKRIFTPGEKEYLCFFERKDKGVPIDRGLQKNVNIMRDELGLTQYVFPWD